MIRFILLALLAWFLYKLIFRVIIPVYSATRQVKKQFGEMKARMEEEQMKRQGFDPTGQSFNAGPTPKKESASVPKSDYIEFEEIK